MRLGKGWSAVLARKPVSRTLTLVIFLTTIGIHLAQGQTYSLLYQFRSGGDGSNPAGGLTIDGKRKAFYGTTSSDGKMASGTVFKLNATGESVLYSFTGSGGDGGYPYAPGSLVLDPAGNLYGTTQEGGIVGGNCSFFGCGTVYRVDQTGHETVLYQFKGGTDGATPFGGVVRDSAGNLYGTTLTGGQFGVGTVFKLDSLGNETVLHTFSFNGDGLIPYSGVIRDAAGNLYGTTTSGGTTFAGTVFKIDPSGNETVLYSFGSFPGDGATPYSGLAMDTTGNLYGMTQSGGADNLGTIFKITVGGAESVLYSFATSGDAQMPFLGGLVLDPAGNIYGTTPSGGAFSLGALFKLDSGGIETVLHSFNGTDGKIPYGALVRDGSGNIYGTTYAGGAHGGGVVFRLKP